MIVGISLFFCVFPFAQLCLKIILYFSIVEDSVTTPGSWIVVADPDKAVPPKPLDFCGRLASLARSNSSLMAFDIVSSLWSSHTEAWATSESKLTVVTGMFASLKQKTCGKRDKTHGLFKYIILYICCIMSWVWISRAFSEVGFESVSGVGLRVSGFGFRFSGFGLRVSDFGFLSSAPLALVCGCRLFKGCRPQRAGSDGVAASGWQIGR